MIVNKLVNKNFSNNANNYDNAGKFQRAAADDFFQLLIDKKILKKSSDHSQSICEIGAGTGFLSQKIAENTVFEKFMVSDISDEMLNVCQNKISQTVNINLSNDIAYQCYDFNSSKLLDGKFSVIISAMALQWAGNLEQSVNNISKMLKKYESTELVCFTTLTNNTFKKLHQAFKNCDLQYPGPKLLTVEQIKKSCSKTFIDVEVCTQNYEINYPNIFQFLKGIQLTGAGNATDSIYSVKAMRAVVKEYEKLNKNCCNATADYEVATVICKRVKI